MSDTTNCLVCGKNIDVQVALYNTSKPNCCDNCAISRRDEYKLQEIKQEYQNVLSRLPHMDVYTIDTTDLVWLIEQLEQAQEQIIELERECDQINEDNDAVHGTLLERERQLEQAQTENDYLRAENQKLKQQLEKAQIALYTCESYNKTVCELQAELVQSQATNQKLKEELAWYATESNYKGDYKYWGTLPAVLDDRGQRARKLLQELKQ